MNIGYVSVLLLVAGALLAGIGAYGIAKYAFRISSGKGMATLLFPPYTFYFSFYELQEEGKERHIFLWLWGVVVLLVALLVFWQPLSYVFAGRAAELDPPQGDEEVAQYMDQSGTMPVEDTTPKEEPANDANNTATNTQTAGATNGTNNAVAGTNNAAAGTNNTATNGTNNAPATNGAAPATAGATNAAPAEAAPATNAGQ